MRYSINNQTEKWKVTNDDEPQHGTVTFWNGHSYGFLRPDAPSPNLFFHVTELNGQRVKHGDRVSFQTAPDKRNPAKFCAVAVQVGGATVEFEPRVDRQGRPCAKTVKLTAE